jgi:hypothetical protein
MEDLINQVFLDPDNAGKQIRVTSFPNPGSCCITLAGIRTLVPLSLVPPWTAEMRLR